MSPKPRGLKDVERSRKPKRSPYDRVLIVCEGKKTEPYYFTALVIDLGLNSANVKVDGESESSPRSVVEYAKDFYKKDLKINGKDDGFDRVYCVFDQDSHSTYKEAISSIETATPKGVFFAITSVPCFEFWLLLHFKQTTKAFIRSATHSPCDNVIHESKAYLPNYDYDKGDPNIYAQLKSEDKPLKAMISAKQINEQAKASGFDNPSTTVPELIEYLQSLGKPKQ